MATGVLNIWMHPAAETAAWHAATRAEHPGRAVLGLGASHAKLVEAGTGYTYRRPLSALREYLDALDNAPSPAPAGQRILAALGPKMLELAAARSLGAHPYLVNPEHTGIARETLGPDAVLAPELKVVLDTDADRVRTVARGHLASYLELPNYIRNLLRSGFRKPDFEGGGSDRLIDGVVAWGDVEAVVKRAQAHFDAGADHVCIQVLTADRREIPFAAWSELAPVLREEIAPRRSAFTR